MKYTYQYAEEIEKITAGGTIDIELEVSKQCVMEIVGVFYYYTGATSRQFDLRVYLADSNINDFINDDINLSNGTVKYYRWPTSDALAEHGYWKPNRLVLYQGDKLKLRGKSLAAGEEFTAIVRALLSIYAPPTVTITSTPASHAVLNSFSNRIIGGLS